MHNMENKNYPPPPPSRERPALWAVLGVVVGFTLPMLACIGMFLAVSFGFGLMATQGSTVPVSSPVYVSGPITGPAVAIIDVAGQIVSGEGTSFSTSTEAASRVIARQIQLAANDPDVRAILLYVNSPGGSVVGSDEIFHELQKVNKPIVVYMGELAASGGYYVSMAGEYIIANPNSLVGSIGVISTFPNVEDLLDKVGVRFNVFTSGDSKDFGSLYREMTPEEEAYWQGVINETYENFVNLVVEGRSLTRDEVLAFADGRVYTARQAKELGMLDELGYEEDAIAKAAALASIPGSPRVVRYPASDSLLSLLGGLGIVPQQAALDDMEQWLAPRLEYRWTP